MLVNLFLPELWQWICQMDHNFIPKPNNNDFQWSVFNLCPCCSWLITKIGCFYHHCYAWVDKNTTGESEWLRHLISLRYLINLKLNDPIWLSVPVIVPCVYSLHPCLLLTTTSVVVICWFISGVEFNYTFSHWKQRTLLLLVFWWRA